MLHGPVDRPRTRHRRSQEPILDGRYVSHTGMGVGIIGARRLTDQFEIRSAPGQGTTIVLGKRIPSRSPRIAPITAAQVSAKLQTGGDLDLGQELREQNKELMRSLEETRGRQVEIERLNRELEETNRGVVALYMELDERALDLARTADMKSRILSDISHEVRTPLNAILNISRLLMNRMDGDLSAEQERQIRMIRDSAMTVTELVSDLLELARMEAGKTLARVSTFSLGDLLRASAACSAHWQPRTPCPWSSRMSATFPSSKPTKARSVRSFGT